MKNVLVIAYYFPPTGGGSVQRASKFVKYLPHFGWKPVVLTVRNPDFDESDESLLSDIPPGIKVFRTYSFDPVRWYRTRRYGPNSLFDRKEKETSTGNMTMAGRIVTRTIGAVKFFLNTFLLVPDDHVGWVPIAVTRGFAIIKKEKIDVVYATGKPWSSFLIAYFLNRLAGTPYILDLRDPWVLTPYRNGESSGMKRKFEGVLEKMCFSRAKKIININEQITGSYIRFYPSISPGKFACITHGFDPDDFQNIRRPNDKKFTISYVGTLYPYEAPDVFLRAIKDLIAHNNALKESLRINFIGIVPKYVISMIDALGLSENIGIAGYLPHNESTQYLQNADVLLLLLNRVRTNADAQVSTGKLFEYLASRRPILALIPDDTDAAKLIGELGAGTVVDPLDVNGIAEAIRRLFEQRRDGTLHGHSRDINRFDRKELTRQLSVLLEQRE